MKHCSNARVLAALLSLSVLSSLASAELIEEIVRRFSGKCDGSLR
jgi:hypothetical protein